MSESSKTMVFVAAAVLALGALITVEYGTRLRSPELAPQEMVGQQLFDDFQPLEVTSLQIVKYDEQTGQPRRFEVAQVNDIWSIPSHANYPADAEDQLADAATSVMGREVLTLASESPGDHALYGVIDPGAKELESGAIGVGTRVVMKGADDKTLLAMIIGKEVEGQNELRYVRRVGQDPVYTMKVATDKLSTKFQDWIEEDLLQLSTWDIQRVAIHDHSVDETQGALLQRGRMALRYDDAGEVNWSLVEDERFDGRQWVDGGLEEDEELNSEALNDMRNALDDLKIVDVRRKPAGLSADLAAAEGLVLDNEARLSLMSKGFFPARVGGGPEQLYSNEGDIRVVTKEGVEYVLRFGDIADSKHSGDKPAESEDGEPANSNADLNRYIFVMAEFNADVIPKPELEPLPEAKAEDEADEGDSADTDEADVENAEQDSNADEAKPEAETAKEKDAEAQEKELQAERERIEKENQRKQEQYDKKIADGKEKVRKLNARFADWYYIIPDDVYQNIHLTREKIVQLKASEDDEDAEGNHTGQGHNHGQPESAEASPAASPMSEFNRLKNTGLDD